MNSRERVLTALAFKEADRVPIDLGGTTGASGIHVIAYHNLKKYLGIGGPVKCNDVMQQLAQMEDVIRERLHIDVVQVNALAFHQEWAPLTLHSSPADMNVLYPAGLDIQVEANGARLLKNAAGQRFQMPQGAYYFDAEDGKSWFSWPYELTDENLAALQRNTRRIYEETGYAISANFGGNFFSVEPEFMMDLMLEPEKIGDMLAQRCDDLIKKYTLLHQAIGEYTFCISFADDFGSQNAPMVSPDIFHERIAPHYKKFTSWLRSKTNWKLYLHSCGAIEPLIDSIIEMGADILNPVQISATGMDPVKLKEKYGRKIIFWGGGCDTQNILGKADKDTLEEHVKNLIRIFAPGGGFVFNQVHAIQPLVSPEDICAVFETAFKYGQYPIK
ncbi:MAG: uroporphyrinogen decarboxylase family protein [Lentisphaerota bacterium]